MTQDLVEESVGNSRNITSKNQASSQNSSDNETTIENAEKIRQKSKRKKLLADSCPMQPPCSCKQKCIEKIDSKERKTIYTQYCSLEKTLQKEYLFQRVQSFPKKRKKVTIKSTEGARKSRKVYRKCASLNTHSDETFTGHAKGIDATSSTRC